jgi:uncharacterized protein YbbK (DUF523 family)/uncharacterized protein YbgA (DUF1722 family)
MKNIIKVGVSACLLGEKVRYDGGHKHDRYITDTLGRFFSFVPVCPEVESGMTTPREAMRLEGDPASPRLLTRLSRIDKTEQMLSFCRTRLADLEKTDLCGFIFKKDSPSSGLFRVKVYDDKGMPKKTGSGLFAAAVAKQFPLLPLEEEGRLFDPDLRENFIERVFSYRRWKDFLGEAPDIGRLVAFHTGQKKEISRQELFSRYEELLLTGLTMHATAKKNTNVLQHIMGYFKKELSPAEKAELQDVITSYHDHLVPLIVPITLLRHYVNKYEKQYLKGQAYLSPHPAELMLRGSS